MEVVRVQVEGDILAENDVVVAYVEVDRGIEDMFSWKIS
jgi:hypothetical protein